MNLPRKDGFDMEIHEPLPEATEQVLSAVVDAGLMVHRQLGPGFNESAYRNALCIELRTRGKPFEMEKTFVVKYRDQAVATQRVDLVVGETVIVELKATFCLEQIHYAQLLSYLRASGLRAGLLMNFGGRTLRAGLKRLVI
jgi:GxxExxY protein